MAFLNSYFEDEVREGFYIPGMVKRSWAMQIHVLKIIEDICTRHKIKWFADCGTLLGTVRHGGFIPWDDDLDICMLRDDYIRFNNVVRDELPEGYRVLNLDNESEYDNFITRITNGQAISTNIDYLKRNYGFPYTAGVDIFPLDYLMPDHEEEEKRRVKAKTIWDLAKAVKEKTENRNSEEIAEYVEGFTGLLIDRSLPIEAALLRIIEAIFKEHMGENSECVALMPLYIQDGSHIYPIDFYKCSIKMPFEVETIEVPAAYDDVLKIEYGNWIIVNKKGGFHNYPVYKNQEEILVNAEGSAPYLFLYKGVDSRKLNEEREKHFVESDENVRLLQSIENMHGAIFDLLEKKNGSEAMRLLNKCQENAISVGTQIDEEKGEGTPTVKLLEDYCELTYGLHERIMAGDGINVYKEKKNLSKTIKEIRNSYKNDIKRHKEVIFMPVKAKDWKYLDGMYQQLLSDTDVTVYVMPLPYAERNDDGTIGTYYYDYDSFPEDLNFLSFKSYDFNQRHPDQIIIQNPFDEYESGMTVHQFFYAKNLRAYTNELVYVHSFELDEICDEKSLANVPAYVMKPGVIYSDKIFVPSDNVKKVYCDYLTEVTGKNSRREWEDKIHIAGYDCKSERLNRADTDKKTVLFYVSASDYYVHGEKAIAWVENVFNIFLAHKLEIKIIWIEEDEAHDNIMKVCPEIYKNYMDLITIFETEQIGQRMNFKNMRSVIADANAYYGSAGYVMNLCNRKKIPIMIRNIQL